MCSPSVFSLYKSASFYYLWDNSVINCNIAPFTVNLHIQLFRYETWNWNKVVLLSIYCLPPLFSDGAVFKISWALSVTFSAFNSSHLLTQWDQRSCLRHDAVTTVDFWTLVWIFQAIQSSHVCVVVFQLIGVSWLNLSLKRRSCGSACKVPSPLSLTVCCRHDK